MSRGDGTFFYLGRSIFLESGGNEYLKINCVSPYFDDQKSVYVLGFEHAWLLTDGDIELVSHHGCEY